MNFFVLKILPQATVRKLSSEEMDAYNKPYQTISSRKPIRQWPCEIPIEGKPERMHRVITNYSQRLQESDFPKLLLYAQPGGLINDEGIRWCRDNLKNLTTIDIGAGLHYVQEDQPHNIGKAIAKWVG
jgi:haloalkane dehalogenase